jgi:hypothetical protein
VFADLVKAEGIRRGADHVRQLTIIWNIASVKFPEATQIAGIYHAHEHLHDLARSLEFMLGGCKDEWLAARLEDPAKRSWSPANWRAPLRRPSEQGRRHTEPR